MNNNFAIKLWKILSFQDKKRSLFLFFLILIAVSLEVIGIGMIIPTIIFFLEDDISNKYPSLVAVLNLFSIDQDRISLIKFSLIILITIFLIKNLFLSFFSLYESRFAWGVQAEIQRRLFKHYINQSLTFHNKRNSGKLINNITKEIQIFYHVLMNTVILFSEIFIFFGISSLLIYYEPIAFFSVVIVSSIVIYFYNLITMNKLLKLGQVRQKEDGLIIQKIQQSLGGIREVKIYNRELGFFNLFKKSNEELYKISWLNQFIQKIPRLLVEFSIIFSMIIVILTFINLNYNTNYIITVLGLFAVAAVRILPSLTRIYVSIQSIKFGLPAINLLSKELGEIKTTSVTQIKNSQRFLFSNEINVKNVCFSYPEKKDEIFQGVNLNIKKGDFIGIQGISGSGKSTLVDIILGLLEPSKGQILVDGHDIKKNTLGWQKNISYVPQNVFLTDDKLSRNIAFGINDKDTDLKKIKKAVEQAELDSYVSSLPRGLDTELGERGARLSGGQKQRIGIARALYNQQEILVLDETTSSLDSETEKKIFNTIKKLQKNRTVIIISHNKKLMDICKNIYSISNKQLIKIK